MCWSCSQNQHQTEKTAKFCHGRNYNSTRFMIRKVIGVICVIGCCLTRLDGQVDEAKQAIDRGEYVRAVNLLSDALASRPTAETYLDLGTAYARMREYPKAEDILHEGNKRFPQDV